MENADRKTRNKLDLLVLYCYKHKNTTPLPEGCGEEVCYPYILEHQDKCLFKRPTICKTCKEYSKNYNLSYNKFCKVELEKLDDHRKKCGVDNITRKEFLIHMDKCQD